MFRRFLLVTSFLGVAIVFGSCGAPVFRDAQGPPARPKHRCSTPLCKDAAHQTGTPTSETANAASPEAKDKALKAARGLAELSADDAAAAAKQRVCPVSGELLGEMGKPIRVTVDGKTVFLCCSGCEDDLRRNPAKYLGESAAPKDKAKPAEKKPAAEPPKPPTKEK